MERLLTIALATLAFAIAGMLWHGGHTFPAGSTSVHCPPGAQDWCAITGKIETVEVRLDDASIAELSAFASDQRIDISPQLMKRYALALRDAQDSFLASLEERGIRARPVSSRVESGVDTTRRLTYGRNAVFIHVASHDLARLRSLPEVTAVLPASRGGGSSGSASAR